MFGFTSSIVRHQQCTIVLGQRLLEGILGMLVDVFLIVGHDGFGNGLSHGVDLRSMTTASDSNPDIDMGEFVDADD